MPYLGRIGELVETSRSRTEELSVEWRIRNVLSLPSEGTDFCDSPQFRFRNQFWWLRLYTNSGGETQNTESGWMLLELCRNNVCPDNTFHISVGISGSREVRSREVEKGWWMYCSWGHFCSRSELMEHRSRLMPDGIFSITCAIRTVVPNVSRGGEKALQDFAKLLASSEDSNVTVQVGDVVFNAHRSILSVRSPVFSAMFQHESEEKLSNNIKIDDCEPDVFKEYLQYLYTGSVQSLTVQNVFGLYRIADKYLADDLRQLCLEHIQDTLSVETFCEALKLALTHEESGLLQVTINFGTKNFRQIISSVEWQNFNCEYPREANKILIKCCPRS